MLLILFGPPAVGKMTVGRALAAKSSLRLFHNHMTIEPLIEIFGYGTPAFNTLNDEFRKRILEEAAAHSHSLVFTLVWALDSAEDRQIIEDYIEIFAGKTAFVELRAPLETRLIRNRTEERLLHKASKRDVQWSDENVRELDDRWVMTSATGRFEATELLEKHPYLVLDTEDLSAHAAATTILTWLKKQSLLTL